MAGLTLAKPEKSKLFLRVAALKGLKYENYAEK
jgi:hypothetical protein